MNNDLRETQEELIKIKTRVLLKQVELSEEHFDNIIEKAENLEKKIKKYKSKWDELDTRLDLLLKDLQEKSNNN
ncbi:hypothetical protein NC796_07490 [Aliifodinibius sp. S!AR15-10]|uniref:hypothetical protein n=1 Tax=Aliifodinibius sp. S!AR15-10 TaxID=2950437 RepID=UPI002867095F|nr:hypothetical protein [Aliifodinibius sp. S!AR15-10]MDR8390975.1 hypothetical protein [Aliifodinibius sp. S!AR15-10]